MKVANLIADIEYVIPQGTIKEFKNGVSFRGLERIAEKFEDLADIRTRLDGKMPAGEIRQNNFFDKFQEDTRKDNLNKNKMDLPQVDVIE